MKTITPYFASTPNVQRTFRYFTAYEPSLENGQIHFSSTKPIYVDESVRTVIETHEPNAVFGEAERLFDKVDEVYRDVFPVQGIIQPVMKEDRLEMSFYTMKGHLLYHLEKTSCDELQGLFSKTKAWLKPVAPVACSKEVLMNSVNRFMGLYIDVDFNRKAELLRDEIRNGFPFDCTIYGIINAIKKDLKQ